MKNEKIMDVNQKVADLLKPVLADQYVLYTKLRNYHWNITGNMFYKLHEKFEEFYDDIADDIDEIAERIRTLGVYSPGSMSEFLKLAVLKEEKEGNYPDQKQMALNIIADFDLLTGKLKNVAAKVQSEFGDEVTAGLLYEFVSKYEKTVWMLKSTFNN